MKTRSFKQKVHFNVLPHEVFEALMDSKKHTKFSGDTASISRAVGGKIKAYGDYIEGKNVELVKDKKIVQEWHASNWPEGHYSIVTFKFSPKSGGTDLEFSQLGIPESDFDGIKQGWEDYYWKPIKEMLE